MLRIGTSRGYQRLKANIDIMPATSTQQQDQAKSDEPVNSVLHQWRVTHQTAYSLTVLTHLIDLDWKEAREWTDGTVVYNVGSTPSETPTLAANSPCVYP
ncbi:hypothetical protein AVEN_31865-1 [Araneus ventricosus]|uniref:Uncharacterized protein n=1 Tax=Araneus ventricosus TaxID=182803 RepID=A0A4Y2F632_ARAVE|nr:hypothetical protein AVEN_31865-1 [Araneus ventricosus]